MSTHMYEHNKGYNRGSEFVPKKLQLLQIDSIMHSSQMIRERN